MKNLARGGRLHDEEIRLRESFFNTNSVKRFYCPAHIHWGDGSFELGLELIRDYRCWVFFDQSLEESSFLVKLRSSAADQSQFIKVLGPPTPELILELVDQLTESPEVVVAIGGGSTTDLAKGVVGQVCFGSIDGIGMSTRLGEIPQQLNRPLMISFPSTAGTGAETSRYYVTYESDTGNKVHGKTWHLVFDWVFLDPSIAMTAPTQVKIESAFDTFVHFTESSLCLFEESWLNYALCEHGLSKLRAGLSSIIANPNSLSSMTNLLSAASFGGVVISNVRTGHIHEMGGAFLRGTNLNHPQSLALFFREGMRDVHASPLGKGKLDNVAKWFRSESWDEVIEYWYNLFEGCGTSACIKRCLSVLSRDQLEVKRAAVLSHVLKDKVWNQKECPITLSTELFEGIFDRAVREFSSGES